MCKAFWDFYVFIFQSGNIFSLVYKKQHFLKIDRYNIKKFNILYTIFIFKIILLYYNFELFIVIETDTLDYVLAKYIISI